MRLKSAVIVCCVLMSPGWLDAQSKPAANDAAAALREGFAEVSGYVTKAASLVPPDKYIVSADEDGSNLWPTDRAHRRRLQLLLCGGTGQKVEWSEATEKGSTDKATLLQKLKQSTDACNATTKAPGRPANCSGTFRTRTCTTATSSPT